MTDENKTFEKQEKKQEPLQDKREQLRRWFESLGDCA